MIANSHKSNPDMPTDPVLRARFIAIRTAGGNVKVARAVGLKNHGSVRRWMIDGTPSPEQARALVKLCGNVVSLADILPDVYGGLSVTELGYAPEQGTVQQ